MTPHQVVAVGLRLIAILWVFHSIGQFIGLLSSDDPDGWPLMGFFTVVQFGLCALLWFFPASIATKLLPSAKDEVVSAGPPGPQDWLAVGTIGIGIWLLSGAIPDAFYWSIFVGMNPFGGFSTLDADGKAAVITTGFQNLLGVWLIVGGKGLAALLWKARTGGAAKS